LSKLARWRGVAALVRDAVEHGSRAIERVQLETAGRTFTILEHIPPIAGQARLIHTVHDTSITAVYGVIRAVNTAVGTTVAVVLEQVEQRVQPGDGAAPDSNSGDLTPKR